MLGDPFGVGTGGVFRPYSDRSGSGKIFKKMSSEGLPMTTEQVYTKASSGGAAREAKEGKVFDILVVENWDGLVLGGSGCARGI